MKRPLESHSYRRIYLHQSEKHQNHKKEEENIKYKIQNTKKAHEKDWTSEQSQGSARWKNENKNSNKLEMHPFEITQLIGNNTNSGR